MKKITLAELDELRIAAEETRRRASAACVLYIEQHCPYKANFREGAIVEYEKRISGKAPQQRKMRVSHVSLTHNDDSGWEWRLGGHAVRADGTDGYTSCVIWKPVIEGLTVVAKKGEDLRSLSPEQLIARSRP
jgi:hypothetical protein